MMGFGIRPVCSYISGNLIELPGQIQLNFIDFQVDLVDPRFDAFKFVGERPMTFSDYAYFEVKTFGHGADMFLELFCLLAGMLLESFFLLGK